MAVNGHHGEDVEWSGMRPHEEFLELCAISTTGELTEDEQEKLQEHLAVCSECREALREFEMAADVGAPLLSAELAAPAPLEHASTTTEIPVAASSPISAVEGLNPVRSPAEHAAASVPAHRNGHHRGEVNWNYVWIPFAAAVVLMAALGIYSYQAGRRHASPVVQVTSAPTSDRLNALEQQLSDAGHERELLRTQLADRDRTISDLKRDIERESAALDNAKSAQASRERSLQGALSENQQLAQQETAASQNLDVAQASLRKMQAELASLQQQRNQDELDAGSLEAQIEDLNAQLRQSQQTVDRQQGLLADDRDIRDLMGARDLYIAEVYDVARDGATKKPYGRIFYTKGKSLIFYAYDLEKQPGVKETSSFQAWGQDGPDRQQALSLGIFYQDSAAKRRWVLKFDDPRALAQINAVFVTVEPHGGSHRPSGKPLLFASLRIEPNHP
jgi:Putative zinc-finger